ncbi:MAG: hypothetical protein ACKV2V_03910, partial [Blastocatellia bacterium]
MNVSPGQEKDLYRLLLGQLTPDEEEETEVRLLNDADLQARLHTAELSLMDDFVLGNLNADEAKCFENYFLNSTERRRRVDTLRYLRAKAMADMPERAETDRPATKEPGWLTRLIKKMSDWRLFIPVTAGVILALGIGVFAWRTLRPVSPVAEGLAALKQAWRDERPIESRLSGFDHAHFVSRRGAAEQSANYTIRDQAARALLAAVNTHPDATSRQALGGHYLLEGAADKAIDQLEQAASAAPGNALIHNDLGAAMMEKARRNFSQDDSGKSLETMARALEHFSQALQLHPASAEARFNRALCYQYLKLPKLAEDDWRKYLDLDPRSPWADEARRYLTLLEEQKKRAAFDRDNLLRDFIAADQAGDTEQVWKLFRRGRQPSGYQIVDQLLDQYLSLATQNRGAEAQHPIDLLTRAGKLELEKTGDRFVADIAGLYRSATPASLRALAQARALLKTGQERSALSKQEAITLYRQAGRIFNQAGDTAEAYLVESLIGNCLLRLNDLEGAGLTLQRLSGACDQQQYKWLLARSCVMLA